MRIRNIVVGACTAIVLVLLICNTIFAAHTYLEKVYQNLWCKEHKGVTEYILDDRTRIDCLTDEYAIEFDFDYKWAESIGQSLYYAEKTNRKAGIVLILVSDKPNNFIKRLNVIANKYNIKVWTMVPSDVK